jgi:hypothetical protein
VVKPEGKRQLGKTGMYWTDLTQDRFQWRAVVNMVMNLEFHKMLGISCVAAQLVASQVVLSNY